jgi:hypothetical protein
MGLMALLNLEGIDIMAFVAADLIGLLVASLMPAGTWAVCTGILVAYHLFLGWLVITNQKKAAVSLPIAHTVITHLAFLVIIIPIGIGRHYIPLFGLFRFGVAGIAIFERGWLFTSTQVIEPRYESVLATPVVAAATAEDFEAWRQHLAQQKTGSRQLGTSIKAEYEQWLLARHRARPTSVPADGQSDPA